MCGIAGVVYSDPTRKVNESELKKMSDSIHHRGPDDEGFYINNNVGFGFRRLSIIDLHTGHQPLTNEDGTVWIVFNGEIYNFQELRADLLKKGHQFKTKTDTEVIVHLYEEYGIDCVKHLRGMFGFAIWDDNKKKLFCARDRFGIKPFYYHFDGERFVFGSEIKVIKNAENISKDIDFTALDSYFAYGYITDNKSIFKAIEKLKPAHILEFEPVKKEIKISKYWHVNFEPDYSKTEGEWMEEIDHVLSESVKMRMIADVPLGAFLSGGIDSSSIVALMSKHSDRPIKTFSMGFKEQEFNELQYAQEVADKYGTEHHEQIVEPESIGLLSKLVDAYDEPFADSSAIPTYYVSKFAREHVTVALSGDGGDELFAGYRHYPKMNNIYNKNVLPHGFNKHFWGALYKTIPMKIKGKGITYFLSKERRNVGAYFTLLTQPERNKLFKREVQEQIGNNYAEQYKIDLINACESDDFVTRTQYTDIHSYMVDDILTKVDRVSMQNSLEVRVPIMDHVFAELSFKIPSKFKLKGNEKKYILKKSMEKYLPPGVLSHKKQGFGIPLKMWFKSDLKEYINDRLGSSNSYVSQYLNMDFVQKIVNDHNTGMRDLNQKIWEILFLDAWLEQNQ